MTGVWPSRFLPAGRERPHSHFSGSPLIASVGSRFRSAHAQFNVATILLPSAALADILRFPLSSGGFHFAQLAAPVHVHLRPSCTQSQFTRPMLFNPRIMQRLMTFSMDCAHASPRSFAEAVVVVACPS
jgi:hypothetical protein